MLKANKYDKETLKEFVKTENFKRKTLSFYKYFNIKEPWEFRNELFDHLYQIQVLGRIYIAKEGINAQINIPEHNMERLMQLVRSYKGMKNIKFNEALDENAPSFYKLTIKVKDKIVADGLNDNVFDVSKVGRHLSAEDFNKAMEDEETVIVDMRNHYEQEVGHFDGAILPDVENFREELPKVEEILKGKEDKKVLLYCTGGIRCEKASAYLKHKGFEDVNQLQGGIIEYAKQVRKKGLENKFYGKNFVFDERLGERVSSDVISECHQCGRTCDIHCKNVQCNLLFIQCEKCSQKYDGCCTPKCREIANLPEEVQAEMRKGKQVKKRFNKNKDEMNALKKKIEEQEAALERGESLVEEFKNFKG
ncbi:MAG: rhodanese-related sulfurtransferase [Flavobacteriales bacterium]